MTNEDFVQAVKLQTSDAAVTAAIAQLKRPAGRKPRESDSRLSKWFHSLTSSDQDMLCQALKEAAELAVFEFFCVLDGVTAIEHSAKKGSLELHFVKDDVCVHLNDTEEEELHNIFNRICATVMPSHSKSSTSTPSAGGEAGEAGKLMADLRPGDGLDLHHVPDKHFSIKTTRGYDPVTGPAFTLSKLEHYKLGPSGA